MMRLVLTTAGFLLLSTLSACGSHELRSVSLTPASADARNFPSGQVPFVATGMFTDSMSPVPLTSNEIFWCVGNNTGGCAGNINPGARLDQNGLAQCNSGFSGTVTILAGTQSSAMVNPDQGPQLKVFGTAQLTCP